MIASEVNKWSYLESYHRNVYITDDGAGGLSDISTYLVNPEEVLKT